MPGVFSKDARPVRPGAYFNWASQPPETILPNIGSVVALAITHDWGPENQVVTVNSFADFQAQFGPSTDTDGYGAVKQCFKGEGLPGFGGAGQVLVYRMATTSAENSSATLANTAGSPADALSVTAKYKGTYGDGIGVIRQDNAESGYDDLIIQVGGSTVETYTYAETDIDGLADAINAGSNWVTAESLVDGTALATHLTAVPLTAGDDGTTLTGAEYTDMMDVLGTARFSVFACENLTDAPITATVKTWVETLNEAGKRFIAVVGGGSSDTLSTAVARSATLVNENIVNVGIGTLVDDELGTLSTAQLAPRIAGILAARSDDKSLTFARLSGTTAGTLPTEAEISSAFDAGIVVFGQDSNVDSPIRVEKGLTTYVSKTDTAKPYLIYRNPKFVRTMHGIELELTEWAAAEAIGKLQVNDATRAFIVGHAHEVIQARVDRQVIQPGFTLVVDPNPPPSDMDEYVALLYGIAFGRGVEQIYNTVFIS